MDVDTPAYSLPEPPSSPCSVSSDTVDALEDVDHSARDHAPHPNCPDTLNCLPDTDGRPQHTLPVILRCAILGSPRKRLTIREIYAAMENKYSYYKTAGSTWKQSVRHHLSLNRLFERQARPVTDPGFGSYWTVNLAAPPGTKRPRKRGRPSKADGESKKRGRPRKDEATTPTVTTSEDKHKSDSTLDLEDSEMTHSDIDEKVDNARQPSSPDDDFESEEETMHPFERRSSLVRMQLSTPSSSSAMPFTPDDDPADIIERLDIEISTLRRQASDAVQVSMRLTDQLAQAQAEASRARSASKRLEAILEEESRKRRDAEAALFEEKRKRHEAEQKLGRERPRDSPPI